MSAEAGRRPGDGSAATSARPCDERASEGNVGAAIAMTFVSRWKRGRLMEHLDMRDLLASDDCATVDVDDVDIAYEGPYTRTGPLSAEAWGNLLTYVATLVYARPAIGKPTRAWVDVEADSGVSSRRCMVYPDTLDPPSYQQYAGMHHTVVVHVDGEEAPRAVCLDRVSVRGAGACL